MTTFGNTLADSSSEFVDDADGCCFQAAAPVNFEVNAVYVYCWTSFGYADIKAVVWDGSNSYNVLGVGNETQVNTTHMFYGASFTTKPVCLQGVTYKFGAVINDGCAVSRPVTNPYVGYWDANNNYGTPIAFTENTMHRFSVYIDYTEVGPGAAITTKLHYYKNAVYNINLYSSTTNMVNYMEVYAEGGVRYAALDSNLSNSHATSMRVRKGGVTYAVLDQWSPS